MGIPTAAIMAAALWHALDTDELRTSFLDDTAAACQGRHGLLFSFFGKAGSVMVVIMKPGFSQEELQGAIQAMEAGGAKVMVSQGSETTILGAEGDPSRID